jgi:hypothetical protein
MDGLQLAEREQLRPTHPKLRNHTSGCPPEEVRVCDDPLLCGQLRPSGDIRNRSKECLIAGHLSDGKVFWDLVSTAADVEISGQADGDGLCHVLPPSRKT